MKIGVFLPSFLFPGAGPGQAQRLRDFARRAEELGFTSLWITDHIVTAKRFYKVSWLDSLITLSHVAAVTEHVKLGTSILIAPLRQPAVLAKEVASLHHLSGGRYIFGVGVGWYDPEFRACGVTKQTRGGRTDEVIEATLALMRGDDVTFDGRYYQLDDVTVEPHPPVVPECWIGGGRQLAHMASPEEPAMNPAVLDRIARYEGWIARPTCPSDMIAMDKAEIDKRRIELGVTEKPFTYAHENFTWLQETGSTDEIEAEQQRRFGAVVSEERPWDYIDAVYLTGSIDRIQQRIEKRRAAGIKQLMLHTLTADLDQLELMAKHVIQPFGDR